MQTKPNSTKLNIKQNKESKQIKTRLADFHYTRFDLFHARLNDVY